MSTSRGKTPNTKKSEGKRRNVYAKLDINKNTKRTDSPQFRNDSSLKQIAAFAPHPMMQENDPTIDVVRGNHHHYATARTDSAPKS